MRISDWSSDVCSSDLREPRREPARLPHACEPPRHALCVGRPTPPWLWHRPSDRLLPPRRGFRSRRRSSARSEEHTSELQSLMRISYAVFCLKKKKHKTVVRHSNQHICSRYTVSVTHKHRDTQR